MKTQKTIMLKIGGAPGIQDCSRVQATNYILTPDNKLKAIDSSQIIPFDLNSVVNVAPNNSTTINELGRQLLKAAFNGDINELRNLLSKGAPFTADWLGTSPLHMAAQKNHLEICELLLKAGISKDARTKVDRTPLHIAAYEGHYNVVAALVDVGADLDSKDLLGMTPLHWAVQNGHYSVAEYLVQNGALISLTNKFELTPLDIANQIGRMDIVKFLTSYSMDSSAAAQNLVMQLQAENKNNEIQLNQENELEDQMTISVEPIIVSDDNEAPEDQDIEEIRAGGDEEVYGKSSEEIVQSLAESDTNFSAIKFLQEHGITMLSNENDDSNILNSVMENGHSVVLTDVGKEVLNTFKQSEEQRFERKKIITISPEEFLAMTANSHSGINTKQLNKLKVVPMKSGVKRIVMKKNRIVPITNVSTLHSSKDGKPASTDMELVMKQLIEARKTIEEYKVKLHKKEQEAERYKLQLKQLLMNQN